MKAASSFEAFSHQNLRDDAEMNRAVLRSDLFRRDRERDWAQLDAILAQMERGRVRRLSDEELLALPVLYRTAVSSLAVAREISLDKGTISYLDALVQRGWFQIYGPRVGFFGWLRQFFGGGWSRAVRDIWLDICIALAVMVAGTLVGWLLVVRDESWYYSLLGEEMASGRVPGASREALQETLGSGMDVGHGAFAAFLFNNNAKVAILAFALGFAFGIPSLMLLVYNMAGLGAMYWVFSSQGLGIDFAAWLSIHGTTELFAVLLAGACGLHIGRSMAFPGQWSVMQAAANAGRRAAVVMTGVVVMLTVAAVLEGYARQMITDTGARFAVGGVMLVFWLLYFFAYRPPDPWRGDDAMHSAQGDSTRQGVGKDSGQGSFKSAVQRAGRGSAP